MEEVVVLDGNSRVSYDWKRADDVGVRGPIF